jgi:hypothetical protein
MNKISLSLPKHHYIGERTSLKATLVQNNVLHCRLYIYKVKFIIKDKHPVRLAGLVRLAIIHTYFYCFYNIFVSMDYSYSSPNNWF